MSPSLPRQQRHLFCYLWLMHEVLKKLGSVDVKVKKLLDQYQNAIQEKERLQKENIQLINDLNQSKEENAALEVQLTSALAKAQAAGENEQERQKIRKELGQYIKTIDKCILMMRDI